MSETQRLYVPMLNIPYRIINKSETTPILVPRQQDEGVFYIKTPIEIHISVGSMVKLKTGLQLNMPQYVDMSPCVGVPEGVSTTVFPRVVMHAHLDSIFELVNKHGVVVLGPRILTAPEANSQELIVYLQNLGTKEFVAKAGDEIALLYFTTMPISTMVLEL